MRTLENISNLIYDYVLIVAYYYFFYFIKGEYKTL